ncbi:Gfo/Idh/MocA family protein [Kribbella speibonae]|uniref:Gfo/Idh/MocA family oxidoreductase n=1 Tax=Kribbella speibonae TaxID=1572660 RepID=A0A4R0IR76_9ACTN|nr:Gfo/Idh/MocA family oxidoreductase [Kribbella speibonae]TCC36293.1 Gfo/Idh/MocA family oxidoreductase [Kribbella speibonae]
MSGRRESAVRVLVFGTGGWAGVWHEHFLPVAADRIEIVALVDQDGTSLADRAAALGVSRSATFRSIDEAATALGRGLEVDAAVVVLPPGHHRDAICAAAENGLDVLTEKPLAGDLGEASDIVRAVRSAGVKAQVVQNYRHYGPAQTARAVLAEGRLGPLNLLTARFRVDYREPGSWGSDRHDNSHAALLEAGAHHLDQIRHLAGETPELVWADEWRPGHVNSFSGAPCALAGGVFPSSARFLYEANAVAAGQQDGWKHESYRAECAQGTLRIVDSSVLVTVHGPNGPEETAVPVIAPPLTGHRAVVDEFVSWIRGGPAPATQLLDNLETLATIFAAVEAAELGRTVPVAKHLAAFSEAGGRAR